MGTRQKPFTGYPLTSPEQELTTCNASQKNPAALWVGTAHLSPGIRTHSSPASLLGLESSSTSAWLQFPRHMATQRTQECCCPPSTDSRMAPTPRPAGKTVLASILSCCPGRVRKRRCLHSRGEVSFFGSASSDRAWSPDSRHQVQLCQEGVPGVSSGCSSCSGPSPACCAALA